MFEQMRNFATQPAVRRTLPFAGAAGAVAVAALAWTLLSSAPQRVLYPELSDAEKAAVTETLDKAAIAYQLDPATGTLTVGEDDIYRARMVVSSDGAVAAPSSGTDLIDSMPIGASRVVEAERLRAARERELQLTIMEIEGVESVRVHLAQAEKSVFVRDNSPPRASVMLKLARGRQLAEGQINAVVNLVTGSVPGLSPDEVKVIDQHGRLLSEQKSGGETGDRLELQTRLEEKLRSQVAQLLTPIYGANNFSTEVQIDLDMDAVTSARESWNKDGVVRSESTQSSATEPAGIGYGVPGTLSNTPPPPTQVVPAGGPPAVPAASNGVAAAAPGAAPVAGNAAVPQPAVPTDQNVTRTYELGREVAVSNATPGRIKRLSVAVVLSNAGKAKPSDIAQINKLVAAAVGADPQRGDQVEVIFQKFQEEQPVEIPFYEQSWFGTVVRNAVALICVLLVLFFGLRPALAALRNRQSGEASGKTSAELPRQTDAGSAILAEKLGQMALADQVGLAQRYINERPDSAVATIRQMLGEDAPTKAPIA